VQVAQAPADERGRNLADHPDSASRHRVEQRVGLHARIPKTVSTPWLISDCTMTSAVVCDGPVVCDGAAVASAGFAVLVTRRLRALTVLRARLCDATGFM
jgi:hypothetical protein